MASSAAALVLRVGRRRRAFAQDFMDYEREALTLLSYENQVVPGLLRTEEYARAVFSCLYPPISAEEAEERVSARLDRQQLMERMPWPPMMNFLLEEVILHRPIGRREVLREQIRYLRRWAELPFLGLRIVRPPARSTPGSTDSWCCWRHRITTTSPTSRGSG
jgi:hypothetical protein